MKLEGFGHRKNNRQVNFIFNMLFKVEIVKLIDVFYVFHVSSATAAAAEPPLPHRRSSRR